MAFKSDTATDDDGLSDHNHDPAACDCPIHRGYVTEPRFSVGIPFADGVEIRQLDVETINEVYRTHHSYRDGLLPKDQWTNGRHGIYFNDRLVGAITYNYPNFPCLGLHFEPDGRVHTNDDRAGPDTVSKTIVGDRFAHVARICTGVRFPNLASCGFAKSQERLLEETTEEFDVMMTFIRADHTGSMLRALIDKGWEIAGYSDSANNPSNRDHQKIHDQGKHRWMRVVDDDFVDRVRSCPCTDDMIELNNETYYCTNCHAWYGTTNYDWAPNN